MVTLGLFIEIAAADPLRFVSIVFTVVVSITLHELAHGWTAIWQGDRTPIETGHMTANPIVHMGWFAIVLLMLVGVAFGMMPVNASRFRHRYGAALVAAAGPAMNLALGGAALAALGLWVAAAGHYSSHGLSNATANLQDLLWYFGTTNFALLLLNLLPIPPLDGARILGNLFPPFERKIRSVDNPQVFMFALLGVLVLFSYTDFGLFDTALRAGLAMVNVISGANLQLTG